MEHIFKVARDSKIGEFLSKAIVFILALFSIYLVLLNIGFSFENNALIYAVLVIPVFIIVLFITHKMKISPLAFAITIFVLAFFAKGILAIIVAAKPVSDFRGFYQSAVGMLNGDNSFAYTPYFSTWAYQTGVVIYYAALMKLFGIALIPLRLVNCIFMAGTNVLIYLIARKISNEYTARFSAFLYLLYPAPYFLAPVLTNQHFAAFMFFLAVYILLQERINIILKAILAGVIISVGNTVRPLGLVIIGALIIWGIVYTIKEKKINSIGIASGVLVCYLITNSVFSALIINNGINPEGLKNNFPLWKFVVGLNYNSNGQFSYSDQNKYFYIKDINKRNAIAKGLIKDRLSVGPAKLVKLINIKQLIMWASFDTMRWGFYYDTGKDLLPSKTVERYEYYLLRIEKIYYIFIFILMMVGLIITLSSRKTNSGIVLLSTILLCYLGAHILIEVQVRYRYFAMVIVFILAARGSEIFFSKLKAYRADFQ